MTNHVSQRRPPTTKDEILAYTFGQICGDCVEPNLQGALATTVNAIMKRTAIGYTCDRLGSLSFWHWWRAGFEKGATI